MTKKHILVLATVFVLLGGTPAAAQSDAPPVFVSGGVFAGIDRVTHTSSLAPVVFSEDLSGTTVGGSLGLGTFLSPHWSVQLELALPNSLEETFQPPVSGAPSITQRVHRDYRARSGTLLVGYYTSRQHSVRVGYLGGVMFLAERLHSVTEISGPFPIPIASQRRSETVAHNYRAAAAAGLDVDLAVASHLSVVPQVRVHAFVGMLSVRPGVAVRWTF